MTPGPMSVSQKLLLLLTSKGVLQALYRREITNTFIPLLLDKNSESKKPASESTEVTQGISSSPVQKEREIAPNERHQVI